MPNVVMSGHSSANVSRPYFLRATRKAVQERGMSGAVHRSARFASREQSYHLLRLPLVPSSLAHAHDLRLVLQLTQTNQTNNVSMQSMTLIQILRTTLGVRRQSFIGTPE